MIGPSENPKSFLKNLFVSDSTILGYKPYVTVVANHTLLRTAEDS